MEEWGDKFISFEKVTLHKKTFGYYITAENTVANGSDFICISLYKKVVQPAIAMPARPSANFTTLKSATVSGRVDNKSQIKGFPIVVLLDSVDGRYKKDTMAENGHFSFENVPDGEYNVSADFSAKIDALYKSSSKKIEVKDGKLNLGNGWLERLIGEEVLVVIE